MKKELTSLEKALQIIREVGADDGSPRKKTKKNRKLVETDIDIFAEDDEEQ